jgi:hypothetical protein
MLCLKLYIDYANRCTNKESQFGIYGGCALPHMIIGYPKFMALAHELDWLLALTISTLGPSAIGLKSNAIYTPFMCRLGHSNIWAQMIL